VTPEWIGIVALVVLFGAIFVGFPIAFTLISVAMFFGYVALGDLSLYLMQLQFFAVMRDPTLAAVPFFLFMGYLLEQSGLMERLFRGVQLLFASLRGSLYLAVLMTATIFAAATGIVGSSVTLLGVMAAPAMKRSRYDVRLSAGVITAGGTLGILIPPSVMLIVMGPVVGVPATDLFAAAVIPGLLLSGLYMAYALVRELSESGARPGAAAEERAASFGIIVRGARRRHRTDRRRHPGDARRHSRRHRDAYGRGRGGCLRHAAPHAALPANDVAGLPQGGLFDAGSVVHDPAARRRVELLRGRVLAARQCHADRRIACCSCRSRRRSCFS
jgi:TRAP-type mannitol/chloroaromatic compound transport system permease large subunit